jgi:hypothetical protein
VSSADTISNGDLIRVTDARTSGQKSRGGVFRVEVLPDPYEVLSDPAPGETFLTFCTELNESLRLPGQYYVTVSDQLYYGPDEPTKDFTPNALTPEAAWLYETWVNSPDDLKDLDGDGTLDLSNVILNDAVQTVLWHLAGYEKSYIQGRDATASGDVTNYIDNYWGNYWSPADVPDTMGTVRVLNLWTKQFTDISQVDPRYRVQDVLYYAAASDAQSDAADPFAAAQAVPEPSAMVLWLTGIGTIAAYRLRRRRKA